MLDTICDIIFVQEEYRGFVKSLFVESLDYLVVSSLDGKICKSYTKKKIQMFKKIIQDYN